MDFAEALEFSKRLPTFHPKVFKGFIEWGIWDTETEGYLVLTYAISAKKSCSNELEDYAKRNKLRIDRVKEYLMICTLF